MKDSQIAVVTAASSNHASCLANLLRSLKHFEPDIVPYVYDLGLAPEERERFESPRFRNFHWEHYPRHFALRTYAWKPIIVSYVMSDRQTPVLWLDAGDLLTEPLDRIYDAIQSAGFFSPVSSGTIGEWTYPDVQTFLKVSVEEKRQRNRNAAIVGFSPKKDDMLARWVELAFDPLAICPEGSTTKNHRFDQALLSILAEREHRRNGMPLFTDKLGVTTHNDRLTAAEVEELLCRSKS